VDPALRELLRRGAPDEEVPLILRLRNPGTNPPGVRVVTRFGHVVTVRVPRAAIPDVWADATTVSVKAPHDYAPELERGAWGPPEALAGSRADDRRTPNLGANGRGVVVGVLDWGCDIAHPDLRHPDGRTRLLALWDQRPAPPGLAPPYGYGRVHDAATIDAALRSGRPYAVLNHDPADFDPGMGSHGTHTVSIAAGNGRGGGPAGMAPEAAIVFVSLGRPELGTVAPLGSSVELLEALDFVRRIAGDRPWVCNLSLGRHAGEHTGHTLVEQAMDQLVSERPGRAVVLSGGNYAQRCTHASFLLRPGDVRRFVVEVDPNDRTTNELDIWYPGRDTLTVELAAGSVRRRVPLGSRTDITVGGREVARAYHRAHDPNNGDHQCSVFLEPDPTVRGYEVTLIADDVVDGRVHAWIERDSGCRSCQSRFPCDEADSLTTTGTIANGYRTVVVGAYDAHHPDRPRARFSSKGPTRDGRTKPDLAAPGEMVLGARSTPRGAVPAGTYVRMSGTSMAAPAVTGTVALLFDAAGRKLAIDETRRLLLASCDPPAENVDPRGLGSGYLNPHRALAALRPPAHTQEHVMTPIAVSASDAVSAADLFDAYTGPGEAPSSFHVVGSPSALLREPLLPGDIVVARARRVPFASVSVLAGSTLHSHDELGDGVVPGQYAGVIGAPARGSMRLVTDLRGIVPPNTVILRPQANLVETTVPTQRAAPAGASYWEQQLRFGLAGNTVQPLVDGPATFAAMQRTIETAVDETHYVYLLAWWCDPWVNLTGPGTCLLDLFDRAGQRGVQIRVLIWDAPALVPPFRNHSQLHDAAVTALNRIPGCHAQQDAGGGVASPRSHHQKLLVVEGRDGLIGLCGGIDLNADRIHALPPPAGAVRRDRPALGWVSASGGSGGLGGDGTPLHDVHALTTGPTALPLLRMFLRRWWARSGDRNIDRRAPLRGVYARPVPPPTGSQFVRVGETFDGVLHRSGSRPVRSRKRDVQDIWLRSLLGARRFIYMEEQYLSHLCAAEAIRSVLGRLEHVTILVPPSEITDFGGVWRRRREWIQRITRANPHAAKLHVYTRVVGPPDACRRTGGRHLYVHSKMAVIDDELMLIGSANCNHRGWETDSELVLAAFEEASGSARGLARQLRVDLWAHHLGVPASAVADGVRSRSLWDTAPTRQVCPYDPVGGTDRGIEDDRIVDPVDRQPADPCCTLLPFCP
jgi:phosphatidylserine/phosphatidylglycerophosphate/cardiolipin synthase-like enzyme/subtilisin family serine protease